MIVDLLAIVLDKTSDPEWKSNLHTETCVSLCSKVKVSVSIYRILERRYGKVAYDIVEIFILRTTVPYHCRTANSTYDNPMT